MHRDGTDQRQAQAEAELNQKNHTQAQYPVTSNGRHDDRGAQPQLVTRDEGQGARRPNQPREQGPGDSAIPQDIRNLRAEQHRYHTQKQTYDSHYPEYQMSPTRTSAVDVTAPRSNQRSQHARGHDSRRSQKHDEDQYDPRPSIRMSSALRYEGQGQDRGHQHQEQHRDTRPRARHPQPREVGHQYPRSQQHQSRPPQPNPYEGGNDPFIDHTSPPKPSQKPSQKRKRAQDHQQNYEIQHEHNYEHEQQYDSGDQSGCYQVIPHPDDQDPPPSKRFREQSTQTEVPSSQTEVQDVQDQDQDPGEATTPFDPTAPVSPSHSSRSQKLMGRSNLMTTSVRSRNLGTKPSLSMSLTSMVSFTSLIARCSGRS